MILWSLGMVKSPPGSEGQASASAGAGETLSTSVWGLTSLSAQCPCHLSPIAVHH